MQDATPTRNLAFHRTDAKHAETIMKDGILSMDSRGFDLPNYDAPLFSTKRLQLIANGFKFGIPRSFQVKSEVASGNRFGMFKQQLRRSQGITKNTYVKFDGVDLKWSPDGITFAVDMDALKATGVTVQDDPHGYGGDTEIHGDIPPSCIVGIVSDAWMNQNGFIVDDGNCEEY